MPRPPRWQYTLEESRRQALVAIDFYNRPGDRRSYGDFIVHMHLAWQNLLHADRMRRNVEIYYREPGKQRRYSRNPDGSKKTWDLRRCLKDEFPDESPIKENIEFFIGLRNHIEHHYQNALLQETSTEAHAFIINYESELTRRFGTLVSLSGELKFPVFIQSLQPSQYEEQLELRRQLPNEAKSYITEFRASLPKEIGSDERYAYRLLLVPMKGPKTEADMALTFIRQDELSHEEREQLFSQEGSVIIAEKFREAMDLTNFLPKNAAKAVEGRIPFLFGTNDFTRLRKKWEIGPEKSGSQRPLPRSDGYAVYSMAFKQFVYKEKLISKMAKALETEDKFRALLGVDPKKKPKQGEKD
jgi:hypothetical protein